MASDKLMWTYLMDRLDEGAGYTASDNKFWQADDIRERLGTKLPQDLIERLRGSLKAIQLQEFPRGALQAWIEQWLSPAQYARLKNAMRQRDHQRAKARSGAGAGRVSTDLSGMAHLMLSDLATAEGLTLSEAITKFLGPRWEKLQAKKEGKK